MKYVSRNQKSKKKDKEVKNQPAPQQVLDVQRAASTFLQNPLAKERVIELSNALHLQNMLQRASIKFD